MHILWIIIIGFVAGIIARMLAPGPNNPAGFILTDPARYRRRIRRHVHRPSGRLVWPERGRGTDWRGDRRHRRPVRLAPPRHQPSDFRSRQPPLAIATRRSLSLR